MKKNYISTIEKLIPGGKGLCRIEGKIVFVPFVLPGETVEFTIIEEKKNFSEAQLVNILDKSPQRVTPVCPYYYSCGGCNMMHMNYDTQLKSKVEFVQNLLLRNGKLSNIDVDIIPSKPLSYRNRVQVHSDGHIVGFKERAGNRIIPIKSCPIAVNGINEYFTSATGEKSIERMVLFGEENWFSKDVSDEEIHITLNQKEIYFKSSLFFQSNVSMLSPMSDHLNRFVTGDSLFDLYSGVGLLSSMVEDKFKKIQAVEINRFVEPYIRRNITAELEFFPLSLEKWVSQRKKCSADTIMIDPPRTGLSKKVRDYLNKSKADVIIYVSCDPATMARDLKDIVADKYIIEDFKLFDFYPQTSHMEAVAVLKSRS